MGAGDQINNPGWDSLDAISAAVVTCTKCRLNETRTRAVPGDGSPFPSVLFVGEGPGANEDEQGLPFVGRAGSLLDALLDLVPLRRQDVYITNVVKCRPPGNRDPMPDEVTACWPYLEAQLALLEPRVIATLGRHSLGRFFPGARISEMHGRPVTWREGIVLLPLYHPAAGLRSTKLRTALEEDIQKIPDAIIMALDSARAIRPAAAGSESSLPSLGPNSSVADGMETDNLTDAPGVASSPGESSTEQKNADDGQITLF